MEKGSSLRPNKYLLRFVFAQSQVIATHFDFHWVTQRSEPNQFHRRAHQKTHFHQARAAFGRQFYFRDGDGGPQRDGSQRLRSGHNSGGSGRLSHRFDKDIIGQFLADSEPGIAYLADEIGLFGHQANPLIFAKAQFPQAVAHGGRSGQLPNANQRARLDLAERANFRPGTIAIQDDVLLRRFLH